MTVVRKYNPGFLTDDELVASFCVRTEEFESLVETVRDSDGSANPHQLVIGPRGSGKTTLLLRVAVAIRRDEELSARLFPVVFAEESYEVSTAGEFWLECLSRLADQAPQREGGPDLRRTVEDLREEREDVTLGARCVGALQDFSDREGRRLVLIVENLNMMFRDMADPRDSGWRLRQTLQTEPRIILLASATSRFDEIDAPDRAFYDLFRVLTLRPLDEIQCAALWNTVSGQPRPRGTIRALQILTGGSPRCLAIVARFGAQLSFRALMADLLDLVDDHTEYFKGHLEALPAQERRVYLALADIWKPASAREIAQRARLDTSKCSAQLARLVDRGAVDTVGGSPRRKLYYLSERLYNIYYLMRRSRGSAALVEALVDFMESYYSSRELKTVATGLARDLRVVDAQSEPVYRGVFRRLSGFGPDEEDRDPDPLATASSEEIRAVLKATWEFHRREIANGSGKQARRMFLRGLGFHAGDGRGEDALAFCEEVVNSGEASKAASADEEVVVALLGKAKLLGDLNRRDEELAVLDEIAGRFGDRDADTVLEHVAVALQRKGHVLEYLNRQEEQLAVLDEIGRRFAECDSKDIKEHMARALLDKASLLGGLNRWEEAITAYDEVVDRFGSVDELGHRVHVALVDKAIVLERLNRRDEEMAAYEEAADRLGWFEAPDASARVARALLTKGFMLDRLQQSVGALVAHEEVVRRFGEDDAPALREMTEAALFEIAEIEGRRGRHDVAIEAVSRALEREGAEASGSRWRGLLIRATESARKGDSGAGVRDVEAALSILAECGSLPEGALSYLTGLAAVDLGALRMREVVLASPAADLLLPYTTALAQKLGIQTRVALEVEEVAKDIRKDLLRFGTDG